MWRIWTIEDRSSKQLDIHPHSKALWTDMICTLLYQHSSSNVSDELALVASLEQFQPSLRDTLEIGLDHRLPTIDIQLALSERLLEDLDRSGKVLHVVDDDETLYGNPHNHDLEPVLQTSGALGGSVVTADRSTSDDTALHGHAGKGEIEDLTADVVVVDVDVA